MNNCHVEPIRKPLDREALNHAWVAYLVVRGIGCPRCVTRVSNSLLSREGVLLCLFEEYIAVVAYDPQRVTAHNLLEAVAMAGDNGQHDYRASVMFKSPWSSVFGNQ